NGPKITWILYSSNHEQWPTSLHPGHYLVRRELLTANQCCHTLGRFAGYTAGEQLIREQECVHMRANLWQQALSLGLSRTAEEDCAKLQATTDCLFDDAQTLDRAVSVGGEFTVGKSPSQFFDKRIMAPLNTAQAVMFLPVGIAHHGFDLWRSY